MVRQRCRKLFFPIFLKEFYCTIFPVPQTRCVLNIQALIVFVRCHVSSIRGCRINFPSGIGKSDYLQKTFINSIRCTGFNHRKKYKSSVGETKDLKRIPRTVVTEIRDKSHFEKRLTIYLLEKKL